LSYILHENYFKNGISKGIIVIDFRLKEHHSEEFLQFSFCSYISRLGEEKAGKSKMSMGQTRKATIKICCSNLMEQKKVA
jgi:hypothetical protein